MRRRLPSIDIEENRAWMDRLLAPLIMSSDSFEACCSSLGYLSFISESPTMFPYRIFTVRSRYTHRRSSWNEVLLGHVISSCFVSVSDSDSARQSGDVGLNSSTPLRPISVVKFSDNPVLKAFDLRVCEHPASNVATAHDAQPTCWAPSHVGDENRKKSPNRELTLTALICTEVIPCSFQ